MILDYDMLKAFYASYAEKVEKARKIVGRPLTYAEKVLYAHIYNNVDVKKAYGKTTEPLPRSINKKEDCHDE